MKNINILFLLNNQCNCNEVNIINTDKFYSMLLTDLNCQFTQIVQQKVIDVNCPHQVIHFVNDNILS